MNEYQPVVLRYDAEAQEWKEIQDNDNIRIRLEYDENIWKATDTEKEIPVLTRINGERTNIRLIAEEMHIDRYGAEVWEPITEASYYFETTYDRNGQCSHIWETVTDSKATCDKAGKQHKECTACQEKKDYTSIPALGHSWGKYVVTKKATVFAQGQETRTCGRCKKKETRKTAKLKAALKEKGYEFFINSPTNQIFVILENKKMEELGEKVKFSFWEKYDDSHTVVRFATSWATKMEDIDSLIETL